MSLLERNRKKGKKMRYLTQSKIELDGIETTNRYPFNIAAFQETTTLKYQTPVTIFTGENGSGKSTMIEAIAVAYGFNAEGGNRNIVFSTQETHSMLHQHLRLSKGPYHALDGFFLRAESFYNVASKLEELDDDPAHPLFQYYGGKSLHKISHGESFLNLVLHRFWGNGLYILDEPEAALSPTGQFTLLKKVYDLVEKENSQFIIATHSPILMGYPNATIYEFSEDGIHQKAYKDTMNYQLYHRFLNDPNMVKRILLDED